MTRDDIIELALEHFGAVLKPSDLEVKLAMLAVAQEREACAKICDETRYKNGHPFDHWQAGSYYDAAAENCAEAIRARGKQEKSR